MKRIQKTYENTIIINKSEFITHLYRVNNIAEVEEILATVRKKYYDATHNCYAYIIGDNAEIQKCSDDGEPSKTAGAPMMDVLKKNEMTNILAIVTRYFGGILLGAGGLVRAYSSSVADCLKNVELFEIASRKRFELTTTYSGYNTIIKALPYVQIENTSFFNDVIITFNVSPLEADNLVQDLYKYHISSDTLKDLGDYQIEVKC